jgi:hypothetical protein
VADVIHARLRERMFNRNSRRFLARRLRHADYPGRHLLSTDSEVAYAPKTCDREVEKCVTWEEVRLMLIDTPIEDVPRVCPPPDRIDKDSMWWTPLNDEMVSACVSTSEL